MAGGWQLVTPLSATPGTQVDLADSGANKIGSRPAFSRGPILIPILDGQKPPAHVVRATQDTRFPAKQLGLGWAMSARRRIIAHHGCFVQPITPGRAAATADAKPSPMSSGALDMQLRQNH